MDVGDMELVREYVTRKSEQAFAELAKRHVDLVYSVALRQAQDPHLAEEITQAVFIILSRKADSFGHGTILPAWLCRTARYAAADALKQRRRRREREQEAYMRSQLPESKTSEWARIGPLLDAGMEQLNRREHDAVVFRFLKGGNFREVAAALGTSEAAAKMRVNRALEKLRKFFAKRGVGYSAAVITTAVSTGSVQAAPAALGASVVTLATGQGAAINASTLALVNGTLKGIGWAKAKSLIIAGAGVLFAAGSVTAVVSNLAASHNDPWQVEPLKTSVLERAAPQVQIRPTKFPGRGGRITFNGKMVGLDQSPEEIIRTAYGVTAARTILSSELPQEHYDYIANIPSGAAEALQKEAQRVIGFASKRGVREVDVLLLEVRNPSASGLKPTRSWLRSSASFGNSNFNAINQPLSALVDYLEGFAGGPVIDRTQLSGNFDIDLKWSNRPRGEFFDPAALRKALLDQLGLAFVPARMSVEMLAIDRVAPSTSAASPVDLSGDETHMEGKIAVVTGNATIRYRDLKRGADRIEYDPQTRQVRFYAQNGNAFRLVDTLSLE